MATVFYPPNILELLKLTGQVHDYSKKPYDAIISVQVFTQRGNTVVGAVGVNRKEKRIVDIVVDPRFRKLHLGAVLVALTFCDKAYVVEEEARKFWEHIGWKKTGQVVDKGTLVDVYERGES